MIEVIESPEFSSITTDFYEIGEYRDGKKFGEFKWFWKEDGVLAFIANYENGELHGKYENFDRFKHYPTNERILHCRGNYKNGKKHGKWEQFKYGNCEKTIYYENGKKHGECRELKKYGLYVTYWKNGVEHGEGKIITKDVHIYNEKGNLKEIRNWENREKYGEWHWFYGDRNLQRIENYKNGKGKKFYEVN